MFPLAPTTNHFNNRQLLLMTQEVDQHYLIRAHQRAVNCKERDNSWEVVTNHPLRKLLENVPKYFSFSGSVSSERLGNLSLSVILTETLEGGIQTINCGDLNSPLVSTLLQHARRCGGEVNVTEESSEKGKELTAEQLQLSEPVRQVSAKTSEQSVDQREDLYLLIKEEILSTLPENFLDDGIEVKFNKLAIFEPGEYFQVQENSIRDPHHRATLLIEVYSEHTDGQVILVKEGNRVGWNLSSFHETGIDTKERGDEEQLPRKKAKVSKDLRWLIFDSTVNHQIQKVTSGVCMMLQFDIYVHSAEENPNFEDRIEALLLKDQEVGKKNKHPYVADDEEMYDIFELSERIETNNLVLPRKQLLQKFVEKLSGKVISNHAIAIPLYSLYTSQIITPMMLKPLDHFLFQTILETRRFTIALEPIELISFYDGDPGYNRYYRAHFDDFPWILYSMNGETTSITESKLPKWPLKLNLRYIYTGKEALTMVGQIPSVDGVGQGYQEGENHYLIGAMIIMMA